MSCEQIARVIVEGDFEDVSFPIIEGLPDGTREITVSPTSYYYLESARIAEDKELWRRAAENIGVGMELKFFSPQEEEGVITTPKLCSLLTITTADEDLGRFWEEVGRLKRVRQFHREEGYVYPDDSGPFT